VIDTYGIKTLLNVSEEREKENGNWWHEDEIRICKQKDAHLVEMPIDDGSAPSARQVASWLALLDEEKARPILVHCDHGVMRTGMLVAVYEMEYFGKSGWQALHDMPLFGHHLDGDRKRPPRRFVCDYVPRRFRNARPAGKPLRER